MTGPVLLAQDELRQYLQIEPEKQINMVISLGFPKDKPKTSKKRSRRNHNICFKVQNKKTLDISMSFYFGAGIISICWAKMINKKELLFIS